MFKTIQLLLGSWSLGLLEHLDIQRRGLRGHRQRWPRQAQSLLDYSLTGSIARRLQLNPPPKNRTPPHSTPPSPSPLPSPPSPPMSYNQPAYGRQSLAQDQSLDYQQQQREQPYRPPSPAPSQARPTSPPVSSFYVQALYAYSGADTSSLSFRQGDIIEVLSTLASGWWDGVICEEKVRGWFPSNYVQRISEEEATWAREQMAGWWDGREDGERRGSGEYGSGDDMDRNQRALEDLMRGDDPHNFSSGGNIFSEIAAAAQATSSGVEEDEYGAYGRRDAESIYQEASPYRRESVGREGEDDDEEDFWVPKVTTSGQLFYYNPRTGETSRYMPIDGEGDGVQIHPNDFAPEGDEERGAKGKGVAAADSADSGWSAKLTPDGSAVFYENSKTGERSWSPPPTSRFHQQARPQSSTSSYAPSNDHLTFPQASHGGRGSTGDASVIPGWTARAVGTGDADAVSLGKAETLRRGSANSDDSALDGDYEQEDPREPIRPQVEQQKSERPTGSPRRTKTKGRKTVATAELLAPSPPPLLVDLEQLVGTSLRNILEQVGSDKQDGSETADPTLERDRIAALGDSVVEAVRTLLHASGVLEQVATSPSPADAPFTNEIATSHPPTSALSHAAQVELRPATRRITSTLSKLVLSVRAVWGLLETVSEDQLLESNEIPAEGPEEEARREELHQQTLAGWARAREARLEMEGKLRSEVLNGAREVQNCVGSFVADLERVLSASAALIGAPQVPKALLRTPKALQGSLRTNAAALLLPGGGFGGNWRGNGFVTLPTPNSTPNLPSSVEGASTLAYAYPSRPVNSDVAAHLQQDSTLLLDEAETMRTLVTSLFPPSPPANANASTSRTATSSSPTSLTQAFRQLDLSPNRLVDQAAQLQRQIALFLSKVEDIDVAASVDFELAGDAQSRPGSRRDTASGSGSISTSGKRSDAESVLDPPAAEYRSSVKEARPILAELEISKQALYDIAPALLASLQELYMSHAAHKTGSPTSGPQLLSTSPLAFFSASTKVEFGPDTLLGVLSDLKSAVDALCATFSSLGTIADVQAAAPGDLRRLSLAFRSSLFDSHASFTEDPRGSGLQRQGSMSESIPSRSQASSGSHSRPDEDSERRESVDSDFFFPAGAQSTTSGTVGSKGSTKTSQLFSPSGAGWEERRDSVATSASSAMSDSLPHRRELPLRLVTDVDPVSSGSSSSWLPFPTCSADLVVQSPPRHERHPPSRSSRRSWARIRLRKTCAVAYQRSRFLHGLDPITAPTRSRSTSKVRSRAELFERWSSLQPVMRDEVGSFCLSARPSLTICPTHSRQQLPFGIPHDLSHLLHLASAPRLSHRSLPHRASDGTQS